ncbi:hypothetical protein [Ectobacillus polymachus]|uniref:hypothetical protein n=1 Tax=Ectobacillus polymachus TaxID=1508806 RepID=UPI003A83DD83
MNNNELMEIAEEVYIGRIVTLGSAVLFLIGSVISLDAGYKDLVRLSRESQNSDVIK